MSRSLLRRRFAITLESVYWACGLVLVSVQESIPFSKRGQLLSDGQPRPGMVGTYRLKVGRCAKSVYQLVRQKGAVKDHIFTIEFLDPGVQAFSFTFG
ncbi:MAG: hypothetical protein WA510_31775 [Acidobacteriaceae bacterium]